MRTAERILVTGAAGFVGSTFVRHALRDPDSFVVSLDPLEDGQSLDQLEQNLDNRHHHLIRGQFGDSDLIQRVLREFSITSIVNCAAETGVDRSIGDPLRFVRNNVLGTARLLDLAAQYWDRLHAWDRQSFRFVQISTMEVYGSTDDEARISETLAPAPGSPYAASKAAADTMIHTYYRTYGLPTIVARFAAPYGPMQQSDKLVPASTVRALQNRPIPLYGDGRHQRDWIHVDDQCRAINRLLEVGTPGQTWNFGDGISRTSLDVVLSICRILDERRPGSLPRESLIEFVDDRPGHDRCQVSDADKAFRELNWYPTVPFDSGLRSSVLAVAEKHEAMVSSTVASRQRPADDCVASDFSI